MEETSIREAQGSIPSSEKKSGKNNHFHTLSSLNKLLKTEHAIKGLMCTFTQQFYFW
jgi:hypothetical protein